MIARHKRPTQPLPTDWTVSPTSTINGRDVELGAELSIRGERGRFRFVEHVARADGVEWLNTIGGPAGHETFRSFRPSRVRTVHRLNRTRSNAA